MSISGLQNTFSKRDAKDIIAKDFYYDDIVDRPQNIEELLTLMGKFIEAAEDPDIDYLTRTDSLKRAKEVFNQVVMAGLKIDDSAALAEGDSSSDSSEDSPSGSVIYLPYDWNNILGIPESLKEYSSRIAELANRAAQTELLVQKSSLGRTKDVINKVVLEPLKGDF